MKNHGTRSLWGTLSTWLRSKQAPDTVKRATLAAALDAELFRRELSLLPSEPEDQQRLRVMALARARGFIVDYGPEAVRSASLAEAVGALVNLVSRDGGVLCDVERPGPSGALVTLYSVAGRNLRAQHLFAKWEVTRSVNALSLLHEWGTMGRSHTLTYFRCGDDRFLEFVDYTLD